MERLGRPERAVTAAADRIDVLLADDPFAVGESRHLNYRLVFERPLQATYRVFAGRAEVQVVAVGPARR